MVCTGLTDGCSRLNSKGPSWGVPPRVHICPQPHPPWDNCLCSPNIALTSRHETSAAYHASSDQRSQQSVPVLKTQELSVCRITGRPRGGCSLYSWKWRTFLSCLGGMKDSSCRRPGPPFSLWLAAHLAQERNWRYTKVSEEEESPSRAASSPHVSVSCLLASLI